MRSPTLRPDARAGGGARLSHTYSRWMRADVAPPDQSGGRTFAPGFPEGLLEGARLTSRLGWLVYFPIAIVAALVYWGVAWYEGTLPGRAGVMHLVLPTFAFAGLPALAWFNWLARRALSTARPLLNDDTDEQRKPGAPADDDADLAGSRRRTPGPPCFRPFDRVPA